VLEGLANSDESVLSSLPKEKLQMGSSEILNWIVAGGALEDLRMQLVAYVPGYRSPPERRRNGLCQMGTKVKHREVL